MSPSRWPAGLSLKRVYWPGHRVSSNSAVMLTNASATSDLRRCRLTYTRSDIRMAAGSFAHGRQSSGPNHRFVSSNIRRASFNILPTLKMPSTLSCHAKAPILSVSRPAARLSRRPRLAARSQARWLPPDRGPRRRSCAPCSPAMATTRNSNANARS